MENQKTSIQYFWAFPTTSSPHLKAFSPCKEVLLVYQSTQPALISTWNP